jgi:acetoin utilization protein AcuB
MLAHELMTRRPVTGTPQMPIRRAVALLRRGRFRHLPILDGGRLCGVLSDRDLQRALAAGRGEDEPVAGVVRSPALTAAPDTPLESLARLLQDNKFGCLPIVEVAPGGGEALVGIVTESDLFGAFVRVMGISEPGSRVVVRLQEPAADLLRVARVLAERDAPLLALSTEAGPEAPAGNAGGAPDRPGLRLILRLGTIDPGPIEAALAAARLDVEPPEGDLPPAG